MSDIKIFIACHKDDIVVPNNPLFFPVQVGTALRTNRFEGMAHDDEGDNISDKNESYCELTAQYWAWKNVDADYYGFFHYRRYLSFADESFETNHFSDVFFEYNDEETLTKIGIEEGRMREVIEQYDVIVPQAGEFPNGATLLEQYGLAKQHRLEDLEVVLDIIGERYPEMLPAAEKYLNGKKGYFCNMFIMKKEFFEPYCEWLFGILAEHENRRDFNMYDKSSYRVSGYLAERLFGIYLTWLEDAKGVKVKELQRPFFDHVESPKPLIPVEVDAKYGTPVALVLSANDYYAPYLGTLLESIKENSSGDRFYDIIVLHGDITQRNMAALTRMMKRENFSIRFFNTDRLVKDLEDRVSVTSGFSLEDRYRLFLQEIIPDYEKVLYLDTDMTVEHDIAELFDTDVSDCLLAAVEDVSTVRVNPNFDLRGEGSSSGSTKMCGAHVRFDEGTIVFNLAALRKTYVVDEVLEYASSCDREPLDRQVLNHFVEGHVKTLDMRWNVMVGWNGAALDEVMSMAPKRIYDEYMEARKDPYIIHYAGSDKPWVEFGSDFADCFWDYAERTPFLPIILERGLSARKHNRLNVKSKGKDAIRKAYAKAFPPKSKRREKMSATIRKTLKIEDF